MSTPKYQTSFKDFGKTTDELFSKGFPTTLRFEYITATENGLKFITAVEKKPRPGPGGKPSAEEYFFGSFQAKIDSKAKGIAFNSNVDSEKISGDLILTDFLARNLKTTFKASSNAAGALETTGEFDYKTESIATTLGVTYKDTARADFSAVYGQSNSAIGVSAGYFLPVANSKSTGLDSVGIRAAYNGGRFDALAYGNGKYDTDYLRIGVGAKVLYNHDEKTTFATDVAYNLNPKDPKDTLIVKGLVNYKFDANTSAKARVDTNGNVGLGFSQKFNTHTTLNIGTEFNGLKNDSSPKIGFSLSFAP